MSYIHHPLASKITSQANALRESGEFLELVTPTTAELLKFWFDEGYMNSRNNLNFHDGQRQAILNTIYCHEILKVTNVSDMYNKVHSTLDLEEGIIEDIMDTKRYSFPRYCMKMATGTGKTWVLNALLIRQFLNAHEGNAGFTNNFLILAPGLIVYERLLDSVLGRIDPVTNQRDFTTSDYYKFSGLFIPSFYKETVFGFLQNNTVQKEDIGMMNRTSQIMITNFHQLLPGSNEEDSEYDDPLENPERILKDILKVRPGKSSGNDLNVLDRGGDNDMRLYKLNYCKNIDNLMVFVDEAHHLGDDRNNQKKQQDMVNSLSTNKSFFAQIDFSATPYIDAGSGKNKRKEYFKHIIVDFTINEAMNKRLIKFIHLDKRKSVTSLEDADLDYKVVRGENGDVIELSQGQKVMIDMGLGRLNELEKAFIKLDGDEVKFPKMLIMCEDTQAVRPVVQYLNELGYTQENGELVEIHSDLKGNISDEERKQVKQRVFALDSQKNPKVVVSVMMLREGFDVNNICVVVPLRSANASILLEQSVGRGLRLMYRGGIFDENMKDNQNLIKQGHEPISYRNFLFLIEHPNFMKRYDELKNEGGVIEGGEELISDKLLGKEVTIGFREGYEKYDLFYPFITEQSEEIIQIPNYSIDELIPFHLSFEQCKQLAGTTEKIVAQNIEYGTTYGDYDLEIGVINASSYNDFISRMIHRITNYTHSNSTSLSKNKLETNIGNRNNKNTNFPMLSINPHHITDKLIEYIDEKLFDKKINYRLDSNWRVLKLEKIAEHIIKQMMRMIEEVEKKSKIDIKESVVYKYYLSTAQKIKAREEYIIPVNKSVYTHLKFPSNKGGLEKAMIEFLDRDSKVEAFCKLELSEHSFFSFKYMNERGFYSYYHPDFIIKTAHKIYILETKSDKALSMNDTKFKKRKSLAIVDDINQLKPEQRDNRKREYVLLSDAMFYQLRDNGANIIEMMEATRLVEDSSVMDGLFKL